MWGHKRNKAKTTRIGTWIGRESELTGDIRFTGGLHVEGKIIGNVIAEEADAMLMVSEHGRIEGEVTVPHVVLNGEVVGDVHADERVELGASARVTGNVFYHLIEMAMGAEVNGNLVHRAQRENHSITMEKSKTAPPADELVGSKNS